MDTNTIIELFEELRKQLTSLSRRIDDRNISAPAPVTTDDKIARLLETAQFTRTNVERVRMELADRITTIGKETENHTEKIIAAVAHPAQPAAQRHIHVIDFNTSWALLYMAISFIVILCGGIHITKLYDRIANLRDTELKYRYVQMMGDIDEQKLRNLNALFYDSERRADRRSLRQQVERYETAVREAIERYPKAGSRRYPAKSKAVPKGIRHYKIIIRACYLIRVNRRVLLILQNHYATLLYDSSNLPIAIPFNYFRSTSYTAP